MTQNNPENTLTIANALPIEFKFYHLGQVEKAQTPIVDLPDENEDLQAIAFRLSGDISLLMLVLVDAALNASIYSELGNILASQTATRLSQEQGWDVMVSPPKFLNSDQVRLVLSSNEIQSDDRVTATYFHTHEKRLVSVRVCLLPLLGQNQDGAGNA